MIKSWCRLVSTRLRLLPDGGDVLDGAEVLAVTRQQLLDGHGGLLVEQSRLFRLHWRGGQKMELEPERRFTRSSDLQSSSSAIFSEGGSSVGRPAIWTSSLITSSVVILPSMARKASSRALGQQVTGKRRYFLAVGRGVQGPDAASPSAASHLCRFSAP